MKAIYYERYNQVPWVENLPDPIVHDDAVVLKTEATGICRSDWHGWKGHDPDIRLPHVPGHEFAGTIIQVGKDVKNYLPGMRVTSPFIQACGTCFWCGQGDHQVCSRQEQAGFTHWGSFASLVEFRYADTNIVPLPDNMTDEAAAMLGCRFGTAYRALIDQAFIRGGETIAVFGCGGVGLSAIQIAAAMGCGVYAIDINQQALALAKKLGAAYIVNSENGANIQMINELSKGGVAISLDAIGSPHILPQSLKILRRRGKHIQVGLVDKPVIFSMQRVVAHELEIIGSHGIQAYRYQDMLSFIEQKKIELTKLISGRVDLNSAIPILTQMDKNHNLGVSVITDFNK